MIDPLNESIGILAAILTTSAFIPQVYKIYKEGIDQSLARSLFNKYKLKVSFLEYNKSIGELSI